MQVNRPDTSEVKAENFSPISLANNVKIEQSRRPLNVVSTFPGAHVLTLMNQVIITLVIVVIIINNIPVSVSLHKIFH